MQMKDFLKQEEWASTQIQSTTKSIKSKTSMHLTNLCMLVGNTKMLTKTSINFTCLNNCNGLIFKKLPDLHLIVKHN